MSQRRASFYQACYCAFVPFLVLLAMGAVEHTILYAIPLCFVWLGIAYFLIRQLDHYLDRRY
jgi:hypothetical protein